MSKTKILKLIIEFLEVKRQYDLQNYKHAVQPEVTTRYVELEAKLRAIIEEELQRKKEKAGSA